MKSTMTFSVPRPLTPLVGRDRELAELTASLTGHRLGTLTGPGGCGKTRLGGAGVAQAIAAVLALREQPGRSLAESLTERLQDGDLLLVLDNCEHLVDTCAAV